MIPNQAFKVTPLFDAEYVMNMNISETVRNRDTVRFAMQFY